MVAYKSLKTKKKSSWIITKVVAVANGSGRLRELFITKFKSQFKWGFAKVVVTRAGRLQEWSQGELWLYSVINIIDIINLQANKLQLQWNNINN